MKFFYFSIFCEIEVEKKVKEKLIYPMFLFKLTQSKIIFGKNIDLIFLPPEGKKSCFKIPFSENRNFFRWILMVSFHAKMSVLWAKNISNQNMKENVKININKTQYDWFPGKSQNSKKFHTKN